jgi:hypothetical protein
MKTNHPIRREKAMSLPLRELLVVTLLVAGAGPAVASQATTYVYTDAQGSIVARTDASGFIIDRVAYGPFGAHTSGLPNDGPGFVGGYEDAQPRFVSVNSRLLDTTSGRYLLPASPGTPESTRGNAYGFSNGNPFRTWLPAPARSDWAEPAAR